MKNGGEEATGARGDALEDLVAQFIDRRLSGEALLVEHFCAEAGDPSGSLRARLEVFERLRRLPSAADPPLRCGETYEGYRVEELFGTGGMGFVVRARAPSGAPVAIKVARVTEDGTVPPSLAREARTVARLLHPHLVPVLALERLRGHAALVMEWIPGESLARRLGRGVVDPVESNRCGR